MATVVSAPAPAATKTRHPLRKALSITGGILGALVGFGWVGLQVPPAPFAPVTQTPATPATAPLPTNLPAPVERFYRQVYGERVPIVRSAVISGRGTMRPVGGMSLPARFRFTHEAGRSYRHYFETTVFGVPLLKVNEYDVEEQARMDMPWGIQEGEGIDQAANLSLWGEIVAWLPAALLTDTRVRWEPLDNITAVLIVPLGSASERMVVRFDPASGLPWLLESMRHKTNSGEKTLWFNEMRDWRTLNGQMIPTRCSITWADDGKPWLAFTVEDVAYNVDVDTSFSAKGP